MAHIITKGHPEVEYLNIGIKASGKLQLLDAMLMEMKKKGLRVLILFQVTPMVEFYLSLKTSPPKDSIIALDLDIL